MEKILNVLNTYQDLDKQYEDAIYNIFKNGEQFVQYLDEIVLKNKYNNPSDKAGYSISELIEIAKYYGIEIFEEAPSKIVEEKDCYTEMSIIPTLSEERLKRTVYTNGVRMYPLKVNLSILIYLNLFMDDFRVERLSVCGNNILNVDFLIKVFITPMLCRKKEYLKIMKDYYQMFNEEHKGPDTSSGWLEQDVSTRLGIPLNYTRYIIDIYDLILTKENEESYVEESQKLFGGFTQSRFRQKIITAEKNIR